MMIEILQAIDQSGYIDFKQLSRSINVPATTTIDAVQQLNNRGYLRKHIVASRDCSCCPLNTDCRPVSIDSSENCTKVTAYSLTPKGIQFLDQITS